MDGSNLLWVLGRPEYTVLCSNFSPISSFLNSMLQSMVHGARGEGPRFPLNNTVWDFVIKSEDLYHARFNGRCLLTVAEGISQLTVIELSHYHQFELHRIEGLSKFHEKIEIYNVKRRELAKLVCRRERERKKKEN